MADDVQGELDADPHPCFPVPQDGCTCFRLVELWYTNVLIISLAIVHTYRDILSDKRRHDTCFTDCVQQRPSTRQLPRVDSLTGERL